VLWPIPRAMRPASCSHTAVGRRICWDGTLVNKGLPASGLQPRRVVGQVHQGRIDVHSHRPTAQPSLAPCAPCLAPSCTSPLPRQALIVLEWPSVCTLVAF